jgi:hypothetical protein
MNTTFQVGQRVRSRVNGQGMRVGDTFEVVSFSVRSTFVGGFVTYVLRGEEGRVLHVGNGHLVLESVS